jgi:putative endonuclease
VFSLKMVRINALEKLLQIARHRNSKASHLETGERGELSALFHLRRLGYVVVARRWKTPRQRGDIDLIAWEGDTLCFVEVKTRSSQEVASAESSVDEDKQTILRRIARQYLKGVNPSPDFVRFDVAVIDSSGGNNAWKLYRRAFNW